VIVGHGVNGHGYVLDDRTMHGTPSEWGEAVWKAALDHDASHIVLEDTYGKDMAENVLRSTWPGMAPLFQRAGKLPPKIVRVDARGSKYTRAVSVSALYESTNLTKPKMHHVRGAHDLSMLEEELTGWIGTGDSPNRLDALVHAGRWLMLGGDVQTQKQGTVVSGPRWGRRAGIR
jgi:phage terminase large subunit-like protein